jgi:hypothetical protein
MLSKVTWHGSRRVLLRIPPSEHDAVVTLISPSPSLACTVSCVGYRPVKGTRKANTVVPVHQHCHSARKCATAHLRQWVLSGNGET